MRLMLDTHAFLWLAINDKRVPREWRPIVEDERNVVCLSVASLWEIAIKASLQKLKLPVKFEELVENNILGKGLQIVSILQSHLSEVLRLPYHHHDPFDRMIIAQSIVEKIPVITSDPKFKYYEVELI